MNHARRKSLQQALDIINAAKEDEQAAFDNLPESLQFSDKGEAFEEHISNLDEAADLLESTINE